MSDREFIIRDPFLLHREGVRGSRRQQVQSGNIMIAKTVAGFLKSSLGPKGMSKLLVSKFDEMAVTSDGAAILDMMDIYHPVAKLLKETAKSVEKSSGDGTKTTIILIGGLVARAEGLIRHRIQVSALIKGYRRACDVALRHLRELSRPFRFGDYDLMKKIAKTMLYARGFGVMADHLADLVVKAINEVAERRNGRIIVDKDLVQVVKKVGGGLLDSELINGIIINRSLVHPEMPKRIRNARVVVLDEALKVDPFKHLQPFKREIVIRKDELVKEFLEEEDRIEREIANKIISVGANVVVCRKRIGKIVSHMLAEARVMAVERLLKDERIEPVIKATRARRIADLDDLTEGDLGWARLVEERKIGGDKMVVIEGGESSKAVTILLRAGSERQLDEAERAVKDLVTVMASLAENPAHVPGGGATEEALSIMVRNESLKHSGGEQIAMYAFANTLETIPRLLARNSGLDPVDIITELRSKHVQGSHEYGIDVFSGGVVNVYESGIIEPLAVKEQVLKTCTEVASIILRIDDIIDRRYAKRHRGEIP